MGSPWKFRQHGESGLWISELFPQVAAHADELCVIRGMHTDVPAHPQGDLMLHTGSSQFIRPSLGAWDVYGLGTESDDLPGFIAIKPARRQRRRRQNYGSAFLPGGLPGDPHRHGQPAQARHRANIRNPRLDRRRPAPAARPRPGDEPRPRSSATASTRRRGGHRVLRAGLPHADRAARASWTSPARSAATKDLYGLDDPATADFGRQCLLARRFVEAGVRFVELTHGDWDQHRDLKADQLTGTLRAVDRPIAGLLTDLKRRGLLDETLVIWGGEFGRTPATARTPTAATTTTRASPSGWPAAA